jgi:hypothetical protein
MTISLIQIIHFLVVLGYMINIITGIYILLLYITPVLIRSIRKRDMEIITGPKRTRKVTLLLYSSLALLIVVPYFFALITLNIVDNDD